MGTLEDTWVGDKLCRESDCRTFHDSVKDGLKIFLVASAFLSRALFMKKDILIGKSVLIYCISFTGWRWMELETRLEMNEPRNRIKNICTEQKAGDGGTSEAPNKSITAAAALIKAHTANDLN